ncbi:Rho GTPase [Emydomyces testavorans]|uniref:Rho GTPase n=1 Tax=Emydomyces testavorans TaxID=2070801 RepID=A0AAF0DFC6_9EURO|nr:Rho GTPase [Emydomyces testavorans]
MPGFSLCGREKVVRRKLVLLELCSRYIIFPSATKIETNPDRFFPDIFVDGIQMELSLWDTAGQEEFDRLRALSYDDTQVIMLCFSVRFTPKPRLVMVDSPNSLENVQSKWISEIGENCPGAKIVLVALKCDLREEMDEKETNEENSEPRNVVTYNQGLEVAKHIGALRYLECSAMRNRGVNEAFTEASRVAITVRPAKADNGPKCVIQ